MLASATPNSTIGTNNTTLHGLSLIMFTEAEEDSTAQVFIDIQLSRVTLLFSIVLRVRFGSGT